ncbi:MAG: hypothetical protein WDN08_13630 [Rhizomicrobium sp.]
MARLDHWKAHELRALAAQFRDHAQRTRLEKYIELLSHTAAELEQQAAVIEASLPPLVGGHIDFYI